MSSFTTESTKSYKAAADIAAYVLVKRTAAKTVGVVTAGDTDVIIGVTEANAKAGEQVPVRLRNSPGTVLVKAGAAIADGAAVRPLNDGTVDDSGSNPIFGYAEEAAAAGDIIEVRLA